MIDFKPQAFISAPENRATHEKWVEFKLPGYF